MKAQQIRLVQHSSAPDIIKAHNDSLFARIKEVEGIDLTNEQIEWGDENESLTDEEIIKHIKDAGFWGWCDTETKTIHVWFSRLVSDEVKVKLIAHEIAHLSSKPCKDPEKEENRCDRFADTVGTVFMLFQQTKSN